jgi:flagellar hook-associated protein FlgK
MDNDLQTLQDGINASIQTLLQAYDNCQDPVASQQLIDQANQLTAQMKQIEATLFHQQTVEAGAVLAGAFTSAKGFTDQLNALSKSLDQVSDIISVAGKLVDAVAKVIAVLPG